MLASQHQQMDHFLPAHLAQISSYGTQCQTQEQEADPRKLCILGLPWDTTDESLKDYFSQFGPLEVCLGWLHPQTIEDYPMTLNNMHLWP